MKKINVVRVFVFFLFLFFFGNERFEEIRVVRVSEIGDMMKLLLLLGF